MMPTKLFALVVAMASVAISYDAYNRLPKRMTPVSAAVVSAPFVGCEPGDMNVLRLETAQGNSSWVVECRHKEFICGVSRSSAGHTVFCHQLNCVQPSGQTTPGKIKV